MAQGLKAKLAANAFAHAKDQLASIKNAMEQEKMAQLSQRSEESGSESLDESSGSQGPVSINLEAKAGKGSATLSMAYSGARFGNAVLAGLAGTPTTECAYVASSVTELPYFSSPVTFGLNGVEKVHGIPALNAYEAGRLEEAKTQLKAEIDKGLEYAASQK